MQKKRRIIGFGYRARTGKDTSAEYLKYEYGYDRFAFANKLKLACETIFSLEHGQLWGPEKEIVDMRWGKTPRQLLQSVGHALRAEICEDVWIRALKHRIDETHRDCVISDVRMLNEAVAIKSWGGVLILLSGPRRSEISGDNHASEHDLDGWNGWDWEVNNEGSKEDLYRCLDWIMTHRRIHGDTARFGNSVVIKRSNRRAK